MGRTVSRRLQNSISLFGLWQSTKRPLESLFLALAKLLLDMGLVPLSTITFPSSEHNMVNFGFVIRTEADGNGAVLIPLQSEFPVLTAWAIIGGLRRHDSPLVEGLHEFPEAVVRKCPEVENPMISLPEYHPAVFSKSEFGLSRNSAGGISA